MGRWQVKRRGRRASLGFEKASPFLAWVTQKRVYPWPGRVTITIKLVDQDGATATVKDAVEVGHATLTATNQLPSFEPVGIKREFTC